MSVDGWNSVLVLGGIRSGKSEFAELLLGDAHTVRYVATAAADRGDPEWTDRIESHQRRRPPAWTTQEVGNEPSRLAELIARAKPDETLLVDDLGGWVRLLLEPAHQPADEAARIEELASAIRGCPARLVLVSPEVGLSPVPLTPVGRAFADAMGAVNQSVAHACDAVVLVVAGQPTWLKGVSPPSAGLPAATSPAPAVPDVPTPTVPEVPTPTVPTPTPTVPDLPDVLMPSVAAPAVAEAAAADPLTTPAMTLPAEGAGLVIEPGMDLPMPDEDAGRQARDRLATLDVPGAGLGNLEAVVGFAASVQGSTVPAPWRSVRVLLLHGDHAGGASAGAPAGDSARRADQARAGTGPLARLAAEVGASLQVVEAPAAAAIEDGPALSAEAVESALRYGWRLADEAVNSGVDALVLAACGTGTDAAAAAVLASTSGAEPAAVLGRVVTPGGQIDDNAWMDRCAAVRDALRRARRSSRGPKDVLAEFGGGDIAIATGVLLGATARRTPVLLDGPVGVAAALVSRDLAGQARHWCLLPDHGRHPAVRLAADVLGLTPLLDLRLDLGEGTAALTALPVLRSTLTLAGALPLHPALAAHSADLDNPDPESHDPESPDPESPDPDNTDPHNPDPHNPDPDPDHTDPYGATDTSAEAALPPVAETGAPARGA